MAPYSQPGDVKLGDVPWPSFLDQTAVTQDAADEIDSYIGFVYTTPVDMTESGPTSRPARLLLKRISIALMTGRVMLEAAAHSQDEVINAYGRRMLDEAHRALESIRNGDVVLDGAVKVPDPTERTSGPLIHNEDPVSQVESFYGYFDPRSTATSYPRTP